MPARRFQIRVRRPCLGGTALWQRRRRESEQKLVCCRCVEGIERDPAYRVAFDVDPFIFRQPLDEFAASGQINDEGKRCRPHCTNRNESHAPDLELSEDRINGPDIQAGGLRGQLDLIVANKRRLPGDCSARGKSDTSQRQIRLPGS